MTTFLWTNQSKANIIADLSTISAANMDVLLNYSMTTSTSDADMQQYLDALSAVGMQAILDIRAITGLLIAGRTSKTLTSGELGTITNYVNKWRGHAAAWGWYTADEEGTAYPIAARQQVYDTIKTVHPTGQVVECHWMPVSGAYSPSVHDVFACDLGVPAGAYPYEWDDSPTGIGCVSRATGLISDSAKEIAALSGFRTNMDTIRTELRAAGEKKFIVIMQAFSQTAAGRYKAMPPPGSLTKMWEQVIGAGWACYGIGWWLWKDDGGTIAIGDAGFADQRAEMADIAGNPYYAIVTKTHHYSFMMGG